MVYKSPLHLRSSHAKPAPYDESKKQVPGNSKPSATAEEGGGFYESAIEVGAEREIKKVAFVKVPRPYYKWFYNVALGAAIIVPLAPSIALLVFIYKHGPFGGGLFNLVFNYRPSVQVVISIIVAILAYLNVFVISSLFTAVGIYLGKNPVFTWLLHNIGIDNSEAEPDDSDSDSDSDDEHDGNGVGGGGQNQKKDGPGAQEAAVSLWDLIKKAKEHKRVSWRVLWVGIVSFCLLSVPHVIWTGALTPQQIPHFLAQAPVAYIPVYSSDTLSNWSNNSKSTASDCDHTYPDTTAYGACPAVQLSSYLFTDMSSTGPSTIHSKPDTSGLVYQGRSFGVGSSAGLWANQSFYWPTDILGFTYLEPGYLTQVNCSKNDTSALELITFEALESKQGFTVPPVIGLQGRLPTSDWSSGSGNISYSLIARDVNHTVGWAAQYSSSQQSHDLAIAAGSHYSYLNSTQCSITFVPTWFNVSVTWRQYIFDYVQYNSSFINVTPQQNMSAPQFDSDHGLAMTVINQLNTLSQNQANIVFSDLGEALATNMILMNETLVYDAANNISTNGMSPSDLAQTNLTATAASIEAAIDDILAFVAAGQYYAPISDNGVSGGSQQNSSTSVNAVPVVDRIQLGDPAYVFCAIVMTALLVILVIIRELFLIFKPEAVQKKPKKQSVRLAIKEAEKKKKQQMMMPTSGMQKRSVKPASSPSTSPGNEETDAAGQIGAAS